MGGIDYKLNAQHATYLLMLTQIVRDGIERGVEKIELGQTAEVPKTRLGGSLSLRYMEAKHSSLLINHVLKTAQKRLAYNRKIPAVNVYNNKL